MREPALERAGPSAAALRLRRVRRWCQLALAASLAAASVPAVVTGPDHPVSAAPGPVSAAPGPVSAAHQAEPVSEPGSAAGTDDVLAAAGALPSPVSRSMSYAELPTNPGVSVFTPVGGRTGSPRLATPNASAGHSDTITLTFDDCGEPAAIGAIVDVLDSEHRQALFFITGQCRDRYPWLVDQLRSAGHQVCNHTYSHQDLRRLDDARIRAEIGGGVMAGCPYFRPPYGSWDGPRGRIARIAAEFGLQVMLWDVDTRDWAGADPAAMVATIRSRGGIVLFHLHGSHTLEALKALG